MTSNRPEWVVEVLEGLPLLVPEEELATLLHVSQRTLRRWAVKGRIHRLRTARGGAGRVLIPRGEVARLLLIMRREQECTTNGMRIRLVDGGADSPP